MIAKSCSPNPSEWKGFKNKAEHKENPQTLSKVSLWQQCRAEGYYSHASRSSGCGAAETSLGSIQTCCDSTNGPKQTTPSQWLQSEQPAETIPCFIWDLQNSRKDQQSNTTEVKWRANSVLSTLPDWLRICRMLWMCSKCKEWGKQRKVWGRKLLQG